MHNKEANFFSQEEEEVILEKFFNLKETEQYDEAFKLLLPLSEKYPSDESISFLLGTVLYLNEKYNKAIPFLKKTLRLSGKHELASLSLFHSLMNAGKTQSALMELKRYMAVNPRKKKEHNSVIRDMYSSINKFSTPERHLITNLFRLVSKKS